MEQLIRPSCAYRVGMLSSAYAASTDASGAKACLGTVLKAASTAVLRMCSVATSWSARWLRRMAGSC